jgi:PmbA protein
VSSGRETIIEEILEKAREVTEQAEVFQAISVATPVHFHANRLKQAETRESTVTALRIVKEGKAGFAQASGFVRPLDLVEMALEACYFEVPKGFTFPARVVCTEVDVFDPGVDEVSVEDMAELGQRLIDAVREHTPELLCDALVAKRVTSVRIVNSNGGEASYKKSYFRVGVDGMLVRGEDMLFVGDSQSSCCRLVDFMSVADEVKKQLELAKRNATIRAGLMPVVFTAYGVASCFLPSLMAAFNGKLVYDGASPLKDKMGQQVFDARFNLWDNATLPFQVRSYPFDDEGVPGQRTSLVEKGVVSNFLYDLHTAALSGSRSTGNGSRQGGLPAPHPSSVIIGEGEGNFWDMVRDMKEGLVVELVMGAEQGNVLNGDFSGNVLLGYKVESGEIVGRVKNTMISGNVYQILSQLEGIGRERRWVEGMLLTPCLYCRSLPVATKES